MTTKQEYAQLSLYVYNVEVEANRPVLPEGWVPLEYDPDDAIGFSYGVFRNTSTNEVVVAYTGSNERLVADFLLANVPAGAGLSSPQVNAAAAVAARVRRDHGAENVSFTGHSLGGGLASIMAVWFDRPATIFDPAPFELTARNPLALTSVRGWLQSSGLSDAALDSFHPLNNFAQRESAVTGYYLEGEALAQLRVAVPTVQGNSDSDAVVRAGINDFFGAGGIALHSQALLTAMLMSEQFRTSTLLSQRVLPRVMDDRLYANNAASSNDRNFLIDLIRSEQGDGDKLSHFAADLHKLGTDIAGLNIAAQDALIAQGIEWYYWQATDYAGQEFFTRTGSLLQYTTARGADLPGAQNRAASYVQQWLAPIANDHGDFYFPSFGTAAQWNVGTGAAVTATALDPGKSQIFIGHDGGDTFAGGDQADVVFAGGGDDTLDGGVGNDTLFGGSGVDTYRFSGRWGSDILEDPSGDGVLDVIGVGVLTGAGAKKTSATATTWRTDDGKIGYALVNVGTAAAPRHHLVIDVADGETAGRITVRNWSSGQLGVTLDETPAEPATTTTFGGDYIKATTGSTYQTTANGYVSAGALPGAADVLNGGAAADLLQGLGGNDGISGGAGDDVIEGGDGADLLLGGAGADTINGGAGNDFIFGSASGQIDRPDRVDFTPPGSTGTELARGFSWVAYAPAGDDAIVIAGTSGIAPNGESTGNVIDGGAGDDRIYAGSGADIVHGGDDNDHLNGLGGADVLYGDAGDDTVFGDGKQAANAGGAYTPSAEHGNDILVGGAGNDTLSGQGGDDELYGGSEDDTLFGDGTDLIDTPVAIHGNDWLDGGDGVDFLHGGGRDDVLYGGAGNDSLWGDAGKGVGQTGYIDGTYQGDDFLDGEDGDDILWSDVGAVSSGSSSYLQPAFHGDNWLDGEDSSDYLDTDGTARIVQAVADAGASARRGCGGPPDARAWHQRTSTAWRMAA